MSTSRCATSARPFTPARRFGRWPSSLASPPASVMHWPRVEVAAAHEVAQELLRLAEEQGDGAAELVGHRILGAHQFQLGKLSEGRAHSESGLALYDPVRDRNSRFVYAVDSRVVCLQKQAEALIAVATEQALPLWLAAGVVVRGWALAAGGRAKEGHRGDPPGFGRLPGHGIGALLALLPRSVRRCSRARWPDRHRPAPYRRCLGPSRTDWSALQRGRAAPAPERVVAGPSPARRGEGRQNASAKLSPLLASRTPRCGSCVRRRA